MNLAAIPSPSTAVWQLGPVPVRAYALCIVVGIIVASVITEVRMRHRGAPEYMVLDIAVWAVPLGIVGARLYHVITTPGPYFGSGGHPLDVFLIWHGGLGIWGAVAGGAVGAWIGARSRRVPLSFVADALAPGLPLAQAIGRWGNWFNNELYGRQTGLPWGLRVHEMDPNNAGHAQIMDGKAVYLPGLYQPTFLYEVIWDVGVAILVWTLDRRYRFGRGRAFALYVMAYTVGRFWVEYLRVDQAGHFLGLRLNDWTSIIVFLGALIYFVRVRGPQLKLITDSEGHLVAVPVDGGPATGDATGADGATGDATGADGATGAEVGGTETLGAGTAGERGSPAGDRSGPPDAEAPPGARGSDPPGDRPGSTDADPAGDDVPDGQVAPGAASGAARTATESQ